jgi:hypothetical protein
VSNGNGDEERDGNSARGSGQAIAMVTKRAIAMAMRVAGDKEGDGDSGKSNGDGNKGGRQMTAMRAMATRVVGEQRQ